MKEHLIRQCEALENADHQPEGTGFSGIGLSFENQGLDRVARPSDAVHICARWDRLRQAGDTRLIRA